jgi:cytidylate kinase
MTAITISRQMGSLGSEIAAVVSDSMGFRLIQRELITRAARRAGTPEAELAFIDELGLLDICPSPKACHAFRQALKQTIEEIAEQGNIVIVEQTSQVILKDHPGVLHVQIIAPISVRVDRIAERQGISFECALAQIEASDRFHANYLRRFFGVKWLDPQLYHLVLNTNKIPVLQAASLISNASRLL